MPENQFKFDCSVEYDLLNSEAGQAFLGKYELLNKIHHGTMSQVYVIRDYESSKPYILKAIDCVHNFCDIELMKAINHSHIARVYDYFVTDRFLYVRKEYVKGINLERLVCQAGPLAEDVVLEIAAQLCEILDYLHSLTSAPAIYRDLKPGNLILQETGSLKLIDTDSIRQYKEDASKDTFFIGTEGYASPEQFGFGQTDIRTDIYTFGTTLYYLLTGKEPSANRLKAKDIRAAREDVSNDLLRIIEKCTMFNPDHRYQNIQDLEEELALLTSENLIPKMVHSLNLRIRKYKKPILISGVFAVILLIITATILMLNQNPSSSNTGTMNLAEEQAPQKIVQKEVTYTEAVGASEPTFDLSMIEVDEDQLLSIRLEQEEDILPVQYEIIDEQLILYNSSYPRNLLDIHKSYTLTLTTSDAQYYFDFLPIPQEMKGVGDYRIIYMPADPDQGYNYPYYLMLPSQESIQQNLGSKNYLLVESYNMGQASNDMDVHLNLALQYTQSNSASISEELGLPRLVPVFVRPESTLNGKAIYTHDLSRNTILLDKLKETEASYDQIFDPMDRIDLQLIAMTEAAKDYLNNNGWHMEDKLFMWGCASAGNFANRFTFLHPDLVKAAFYSGLPVLPMSSTQNTNLPYPFGTYDYKDITGQDFDLAAYNQVAKLSFIYASHDDNPVYPDAIGSQEELDKILAILPIQDYPDKWSKVKDLYNEVKLNAQVNLYQTDALIYQDSIQFFKANRDSSTPEYVPSINTLENTSGLFSDGQVEFLSYTGDNASVQKATINEAFWSGTLPSTLSEAFKDYYKKDRMYEYDPQQFYLSILEWDYNKDYQQMGERVRQLGGKIILRAEGYSDVEAEITQSSMTMPDEGYIYVARIMDGEAMVSGVKYEIVDTSGNWSISDGVTVERPEQN